MRHLTADVRKAVEKECWYTAVSLALALPDICGWIETPQGVGSEARYKRWFSAHLSAKYNRPSNRTGPAHQFLEPGDCYALRCAFLHQGDMDITGQRARAVMDRFTFAVSPPGLCVHNNMSTGPHGKRLQLDVQQFCEDICDAVEAWLPHVVAPEARARLEGLPTIEVMTLPFELHAR